MNQENIHSVTKMEERSINELKNILNESPDDIACMILEPIQGEGGDNHFRKEYFQELKQLSIENDFLLIFDEVQTGIGITGCHVNTASITIFATMPGRWVCT